ncbi:sulfate adenylyltransferase subunit 2 [Amycolatopsis sp. QT-25]|uniref:sulfate adenylyltransferase subunit CysD n=1 Tax=Amycolatopsis sp. QT-25 TaxID=3034022 RepID=UPI0023EA823D|nr:sulfate adenylyltransferase subunit CysD [Amycolatopsis sp. QT-25]WET81845.1 sulfate adenylyltransferase subunit 2 [Amycolatopsis sp. QT-25]HET6287524.1 sulfate adenylyltransferase subunit CysD [Amycolatopsis sp.]
MGTAVTLSAVDRPVSRSGPTAPSEPAQLETLESEAAHIIREAVAESQRPVLLFSGGKDSAVLLHLALRSFAPSKLPFGLLHVDTGHNFPEVLAFRDEIVERHGLDLTVASVQDWIDSGRLSERPDGLRNPQQTRLLLDAIRTGGFDALFGGARRDEDRARAKERVFSVRDPLGGWEPRRQRPELWQLYNGRLRPTEHLRVFPLSNWTEADVWSYIVRHDVPLPPIYLTHRREVFRRDGMLLAPGSWGGPRPGETLTTLSVRYRTVGDMSCTGAVESVAKTTEDVLREVMESQVSERGATRADDRLSATAMEDRKREGYF